MATTNENSRTQDRSPTPAETDTITSDNTYPPQRHAGAVGYGPEYGKGAGTADKLQGLKEEIKGKVLHKPELVQHGHDLRTGELKRKEMEDDNMDPFNTTGRETVGDQDNQDEGERLRSATTAPEGTEEANEQQTRQAA